MVEALIGGDAKFAERAAGAPFGDPMGRDRGVGQFDIGGKSKNDRFGHGSLQQG